MQKPEQQHESKSPKNSLLLERVLHGAGPASQPAGLTAEVCFERIQPLLLGMSNSTIASRIGVSRWFAGRIYRPPPRHWQALAQLVGFSADVSSDSIR